MKTKRPSTDESRPGSAAESGLAHSETERQALRKQIRREMTGKRQSITRRREKEQAILRRLAPFVKGKTVAAYHAIGQEADILQDDWLLPCASGPVGCGRDHTGSWNRIRTQQSLSNRRTST